MQPARKIALFVGIILPVLFVAAYSLIETHNQLITYTGKGIPVYAGTSLMPVLFFYTFILVLSAVFAAWNIREMSRRKQADEERFKYIELLSNVKDYAIFFLDKNGKIASWNKGAEFIKGYTEEEVIGKPFEIFYRTEDILKGVPRENLLAAKDFGNYETEGWRLRKDGSLFWANIVLTCLKDKEGNLYGYAKITKDLTEKKKAEQELASLLRMVNLSNDAIYTLNSSLHITHWNRGAEIMYGYTASEMLGKNPNQMLDTMLTPAEIRVLLDEIAGKDHWSGELKRKTKEGKIIFISNSATALRDKQGNITGYVVVNLDITRQKKLREQVNHLAIMVDHSSEAILTRGLDRKIITWNKGAETLFGYSKQDAIGRSVEELGYLKFPEDYMGVIEKHIEQKGTWNAEMVYQQKNGTAFTGTVTGNGIKNESGQLEAFIFIIRDISARKKLEDELRQLNEQLEENVRQKTATIVEREKQLELYIEHSPVAIAMFDRKMHYLIASNRWLIDYNLEGKSIIGKSHYEIFPEISSNWKTIHQRCLNGEIVKKEDDCFVRADGRQTWLRWEVRPWFDAAGNTGGIIIFTEDITEKKLAEELIKQSNERFEMVVSATNDIIWDWDMLNGKVWRNDNYYSQLGYTPSQTSAMISDWEEKLYPEDRDKVLQKLKQTIQSGKNSWGDEYRLLKADGSVAYMMDCGRILYQDSGAPYRMVGAMIDISYRKKAEDQLKESFEEKKSLAERMATIINTLPANIALLDKTGKIIEVNRAWQQFADDNGCQEENYYIGEDYVAVCRKATKANQIDGTKVAEGISAVLEHRRPEFVYEYACHSPSVQRWFRMVASPLYEKENAGAVIMHIDISELRRLEHERMEQRMEEQKKMTRAILKAQEKERNLIGAELHDNVNQILAGTKLLLSIARSAPEKAMEVICSSMKNIQDAIEENRKIAHELVVPDFVEIKLADRLSHLMEEMLIKAGVQVKMDIANFDERKLDAEQKLAIYRIIQEQCTNILKYANATTVNLSLKDTPGAMHLILCDNGKGMEAKKLISGIGLRNMRSRLQLFDGEMHITTAPGKGFTINITIPLHTETYV
jgi:PAS domain S-box-containing protein